MGRIVAVGWDVDKVWYPSISTSYTAKGSTLDPRPYLQRFVDDDKLFTYGDIAKWVDYRNKNPQRPVGTIGDLAEMLTDFFYEIEGPNDGHVLTKEQTIVAKQAILKGLTMADIRRIGDGVALTHGLQESVSEIRDDGIHQAAFSDGLGPFIAYMAQIQGMDHYGIVPAIVSVGGSERVFENEMLGQDEVVLAGKVQPYAKADAMFAYFESEEVPLDGVAVIDDSAANIPAMRKIQEARGVAVAFNPTKTHRPKFVEAGIPILNKNSTGL